jgi:AcrR family transcriptional regulator
MSSTPDSTGSTGGSTAVMAPPTRPKRADARRNYDRLIATAEAVFATDGPEASLDKIAKTAGVGPGTLYRHFPNRRALLIAVYSERIAELSTLGAQYAERLEPIEALSQWMRLVASHTLVYRGLKDLLTAESPDGASPDMSWCMAAMRGTSATILNQAQAAGRVEASVQPIDILRLVHAAVLATEHLPEPERSAGVDRLLGFMLTGLVAS